MPYVLAIDFITPVDLYLLLSVYVIASLYSLLGAEIPRYSDLSTARTPEESWFESPSKEKVFAAPNFHGRFCGPFSLLLHEDSGTVYRK